MGAILKPKYQELIADHERIERAAGQLLSALRSSSADDGDLTYLLFDLATHVSEHLAIEEAMLADLREREMASPWRIALEGGLPALATLKADWQEFLGDWNAEAIRMDRRQFHDDTEAILPRLRERVQRETETLYATALQTGVVAYR